MKKLISVLLCMCFILSASSSVFAAADSESVEQTIKALGIMTGDERGNMNLSKPVTRAEFAKMMIEASVYSDTIEDGSGYSPFKDVKSTHWASGYIKALIDAKWMTGYVDGTFRPETTITFEEGASAILRMLGYGTSDLSGTYPNAHISKFKSLKLDSGVSPAQGRALTRQECMYIFYNLMNTATKSGQIYGATLGYALTASGEFDYDEVGKGDIEGPYVMLTSPLTSILPFSVTQATVYRNNNLSVYTAIGQYDVLYYNETTKTVWSYSNRAIGVLSAVSPNAVSPTSVTVAGNSYNLDTAAAKNKVSATGQFAIGDTVSLLLGMDGSVVDIVPASEIDGSYYGVVVSMDPAVISAHSSKDTANYTLTAACTDGVTRQYTVKGNNYAPGNVISIAYANGELTVSRTGMSSMYGKFSSDGKAFDNYRLAEDVGIMDVSKDGGYKYIYPSRLAGVTLESGNVALSVRNEKQEITHLILNDVTGDMYSYGVITHVSETQTPGSGMPSLSGTYKYIIDGKSGTYNSSNTLYGIKSGPAIFYYKNGQISGMKSLESIAIKELSALSATGGNKKYGLADGVQAYLRSDGEYSQIEMSALNTGEYTLTGYYENIYPAGGQLRIIIAVKI